MSALLRARAFFTHFKSKFSAPKVRPLSDLDINTNVAKDVILYKYDNPRYFKYANVFAVCQFAFWSYLSVFSLTSLRDVPPDDSAEAPWWRRINLGEKKYRTALSIGAFLIGYGVLTAVWFYTLKSVRYLILRQGGQNITLVTYTPFGQNRMLTLSLKNLSCKENRQAAKSQLPLKVKGHYLHYLLDMKGEFRNPKLFDHTAGIKRNWQK